MTHVLIAGVSTRAAAESAARAGFAVTAIDAFGDLDQHPSVRGLSLADNFSARAAASRPGRSTAMRSFIFRASRIIRRAITTLARDARCGVTRRRSCDACAIR